MIVKPDKQKQEQYLKAIEWLVSLRQERGTGRSYLLAQAFVNVAVKDPGQAIPIFDHFPTSLATTEIMLPEVRLAAKRLYPLGKFTFKKRSVRFNGFSWKKESPSVMTRS